MTRPIDGGRYDAAVSIRSGRGSMTHDRVWRFVPTFDDPAQARRFAIEHALAWIGDNPPAPPAPPSNQEQTPWPRKS